MALGNTNITSTTNLRRKFRKSGRIILSVLLLLSVSLFIYMVTVYYHASDQTMYSLEEEHNGYTVTKLNDDWVFQPSSTEYADTGLIFYPGGAVQCEAYAPLLEAFAERGIMCVLANMPDHYAFTRINAAESIIAEFPDIENWYIGGHSLGGAIAAICAGNHPQDFEGLVLCASYSIKQLSNTDLKVLSVYGTEDGILSMKKYDQCLDNLPADFTECRIKGGCHSFFGDYGMQKGDGTPTITREEQMELTIDAFLQMVESA